MRTTAATVWARALLVVSMATRAAAAEDLRWPGIGSCLYGLALDAQLPRLNSFGLNGVEGGGHGNLLLPPDRTPPLKPWTPKAVGDGFTVEYRAPGLGADAVPSWTFIARSEALLIRSTFVPAAPADPLVLRFDPKVVHVTLLGRMPAEREVSLPCVLHVPDEGSFRISADARGARLGYDARRFVPRPFVEVSFPAATREQKSVTYTLDYARIFPPSVKDKDAGFRNPVARHFLNVFQLNPRLRVLANNAASDPVAFTVYKYADVAAAPGLPPLAEGLTALDLVRDTLDRYLGGMKGYGQVGYKRGMDGADTLEWASKFDALDAAPSLLSAACTYATAAKDTAWARANWVRLREWADRMLATDRDGNGLLEYGLSGNSGSWSGKGEARPSNWWDQIGFGHEDAYANALAYRALTQLAALAGTLGERADGARFAAAAGRLRGAYRAAFYTQETGLLGGWRSADGRLHDYAFTFVTSCAVCWDLLDAEDGRQMMATLVARMKSAGFTDFKLGLPGNLIPVRRADYVTLKKRWGGPEREDGGDAFGVFENGGATHCFAYFTVAALRKVGMRAEAEAIAGPMLEALYEGAFQGRGENGMTKEWKDWKGNCWGYEGFLVDGYLLVLAAGG